MADVNDIYKSNSDNIKAEDIGNNMWTMTIKSADVKEFKDKEGRPERKIALTFHEWEKSLPLNATNARSIASIYGHNSNDWLGRQIMLFTMMVDFGGKPTLGIRVRAPMVQQQPQMPQPAPMPAPQMQTMPPPQYPQHLQSSPQRPLGPQQAAPNAAPLPAGAQPFAPITDSDIPF